MRTPSRNHETEGGGEPVSVDTKRAGLPSSTTRSHSGVSVGALSAPSGTAGTRGRGKGRTIATLGGLSKSKCMPEAFVSMCYHLRNTRSCASVVTLPALLVTVQRYSPSSSGKASEICSVCTSFSAPITK